MKNATIRRNIPAFILAVMLIFLLSFNSYAQVNTEKFRSDDNGDGFGGSVDLSLAWYKGNTDVIAADTELGLHYNKNKNQFLMQGILKYGEKNKESYIEMGFLHLRGIRKLSKKIMVEAFLQKEFNKFILLNSRNVAGAGMRFELWKAEAGEGEKKKVFACQWGTGFMWEDETYARADDGSKKEDVSLLKSTNYLSLDYHAGPTKLGIVSYFQFQVEEIAAFRNFSDMYFKAKLSTRLSFIGKINFRYDNQPPVTVEKYDIQITNGLSFEF